MILGLISVSEMFVSQVLSRSCGAAFIESLQYFSNNTLPLWLSYFFPAIRLLHRSFQAFKVEGKKFIGLLCCFIILFI